MSAVSHGLPQGLGISAVIYKRSLRQVWLLQEAVPEALRETSLA